MLIVLVVAVSAVAAAYPAARRAVDSVRTGRAVADLRVLEGEIMNYRMQGGRLPESLADLGQAGTRDPWKRSFRYLRIEGGDPPAAEPRLDHFHLPVNRDYDLYSLGRDGLSDAPLHSGAGLDDVVRAGGGSFVGVARGF